MWISDDLFGLSTLRSRRYMVLLSACFTPSIVFIYVTNCSIQTPGKDRFAAGQDTLPAVGAYSDQNTAQSFSEDPALS
jgi:hypothetical protein